MSVFVSFDTLSLSRSLSLSSTHIYAIYIDVFPYFTQRIYARYACMCGEHGADLEETVIEFSWNSEKKVIWMNHPIDERSKHYGYRVENTNTYA